MRRRAQNSSKALVALCIAAALLFAAAAPKAAAQLAPPASALEDALTVSGDALPSDDFVITSGVTSGAGEVTQVPPPTPEQLAALGWMVVYKSSSVARARAAARIAGRAAVPQVAPLISSMGSSVDVSDGPDGSVATAAAAAAAPSARFIRPDKANALLRSINARPTLSLHPIDNLAIDVFANETVARLLARRTRAVEFIEKDSIVTAFATPQFTTSTQTLQVSWGLDRIDQRAKAPTNSYVYYTSIAGSGADVDVYVLDTGIRATHQEFQGRARNVKNLYGDVTDSTDGHGHGTHCSGTVGGASTGVAKRVSILGVKVLSNWGSGSNSGIVDAINWVAAQAVKNGRRSVISMSLGGSKSSALNNAVTNAYKKGVISVVAAGEFTLAV